MKNYTQIKFPDITTLGDFDFNVQVEASGGGAIGLFDDTWTVEITMYGERGVRDISRHDYGYVYGATTMARPTISLSTASGDVTVLAGDFITWQFTAAQLASLTTGSYLIACVAKKDTQTIHLFSGNIAISGGQ